MFSCQQRLEYEEIEHLTVPRTRGRPDNFTTPESVV